MKITPMNGFGSYGQFIDDADFDNITDEEWMDIGRRHLKCLLTIFRNPKMTPDQWNDNIYKFGPGKSGSRMIHQKKYGRVPDALDPSTWEGLDADDLMSMQTKKYMIEETEGGNVLSRVTGERTEDGHLMGAFDEGDLGWHHNESGLIHFTPEVTLKGNNDMIGSATGFLQTVDYYESVSESFRSELDEMVLLHKYKPGAINEAEVNHDGMRYQMHMGFCPEDDAEVPAVCVSPGGARGLHWGVNTAYKIKGMSQSESDKLFDTINKELFVDEYIYDHHYKHDSDMLMFDNSVCLHRRLGGIPKRKAYRIQYEPSNLMDEPYYPFAHMPEYNRAYIEKTNELADLLQLKNFKRPVLN